MLAFLKKLNSYVPQFIGRNFGRKICALIFAILVYIKVSNELIEDRVIEDVPITLIKHGNVEIIAYKPETVAVTVSGSKNRIKLLSSSDLRVEVPVDDSIIKESTFSPYKSINFAISPGNVKLPFGIKAIHVTPEDIAIHVDRLKSKNVLVEPSFRGNLPQDYTLGDIKIVPKFVTVSGPNSIIEQIDNVISKPILLDRSTVDSFSVERTFQNVDKNIFVSPKSVQISVEVYKSIGTRIFQDIPVSVLSGKNGKNSYGVELAQNTVNVTLGGLNSILENLRTNQVRAFVDLSKIDKVGTYNLKVDCWITEPSITLKFVEPSTLTVKVENITQK